MRKLLIGFLVFFFALPVFASVDHWTCSNEQTVMYFILNTEAGDFLLFDDGGQLLAASKFTDQLETKQGVPYIVADLGGTMIAVAKGAERSLILAIANSEKNLVKFTCN